VNVVFGKGAFRTGDNFKHESDVFLFGAGSKKFWTNGPQVDWAADKTLV
jgi:hypothetical protein